MSIAVKADYQWFLKSQVIKTTIQKRPKGKPKIDPKTTSKHKLISIQICGRLETWGRFWRLLGFEKLRQIHIGFKVIFEQSQNTIAGF